MTWENSHGHSMPKSFGFRSGIRKQAAKDYCNGDQAEPARSHPRRDRLTGRVRIDPLFKAPDPACVSGAGVTFEPGARWVRR